MTAWLWIIGTTAIVWPVIVACYFEREANRVIEDNFKRYGLMHAALDKRALDKIANLQEIIAQQDALIAALWQKVFGVYSPELYAGHKLYEYLGVKPDWEPHQSEWLGPLDYLHRNNRYPWGTYAENLYFSEAA